ncbi:8240_t:CDS:2, partial [Funneliformis mosseae]
TPLMDNEKLMIINVHNYFKKDKSIRESLQKLPLRKWVAEILGVSEAELLRMKVLSANKAGEHLFTSILRQFLSEQEYTISKWKLLQILHSLEYYFDQEEFANLKGKNDVSHHPEVFLDKSYCYLHHTSQNIWVPHQGVVLSPEHGLLVVIFGAII